MKNNLPTISIIVPVYNSEFSLKQLCAKLCNILPTMASEFEVLLINDGSQDDSWLVVEELTKIDSHILGTNLMRNYGQHNALLCGIRQAKYELIVTLDDDLQHDPALIPVLLDKLNEGNEVVYGAPATEKHGIWRDLASVITKATLSTVMNAKSARHVSAFRVFYTYLRDAFANYQGPSVSLDVLLTWGTSKFGYVDIPHRKREIGKSNYTFRKLIVHALNLLTGFSTIPLRLATGIGFLFLFFGLIILLYVLIRFLIQGGVVPGFTFLASVVVIFSGVQLFTLGIMGEYMARMHFRLMDKPTYTVKETKSND
ncbi:MAG: glycosyltransferase [Anaerolinea sp.]|nr:glycosyltransferase [Anaerolinea sp.]